MSAALRNVSAIFFVLPAGSFAHSAGLAAESMRMTPYLRTPRSRSFLPIAQALRTCVRKFFRSSSLPIAEPPPVGGHTGATSDPTTRFFAADLVGQPLQVVVGRIDADVRIEEEQIDAVELRAVRPAPSRSGRASCRDRSAARRPGPPLPTSPGHMAL